MTATEARATYHHAGNRLDLYANGDWVITSTRGRFRVEALAFDAERVIEVDW